MIYIEYIYTDDNLVIITHILFFQQLFLINLIFLKCLYIYINKGWRGVCTKKKKNKRGWREYVFVA